MRADVEVSQVSMALSLCDGVRYLLDELHPHIADQGVILFRNPASPAVVFTQALPHPTTTPLYKLSFVLVCLVETRTEAVSKLCQ
jgi:hypothetical protein